MDSFSDLPESLTTMTLVNNINTDILANKSLLQSQLNNVNILNGYKSFQENTSHTIDNKIHQVINTTHHEHKVTDTDTTINWNTEDSNNKNIIDSEIGELSEESNESDSGLLTDEDDSTELEEMELDDNEKVVEPDQSDKGVKTIITQIENLSRSCKARHPTLRTPPKNIRDVPTPKKLSRVPKANNLKDKTKIPKLAKQNKFVFPPKTKEPLKPNPISKEIEDLKNENHTKPGEEIKNLKNENHTKPDEVSVRADVEELQKELLEVLAKKKNELNSKAVEDLSNVIQRRKEISKEKIPDIEICDKQPTPSKPQTRLLSYSDMPPHLQFNPYITSGYRPILNAWGCLKSLSYIHNETVNIFTHGIPIIYILMTIPKTMPWHLQDTRSQFLIWSHLAGAICPWLGSILYHVFMNCGSSPLMYKRLLQTDMFGIWISQSFGALPMVFASVHCLSYNVRVLVIVSYCIFSIWGLHKALIATTPWSRRICFALPFMMRNLLCLLRLTKYGGGAPDSLIPTILQDVISGFGGMIGASFVPEKWIRGGQVDRFLNSHNIMHVLVVWAMWCMQVASIKDIVWMDQSPQCVNTPSREKITERAIWQTL
uniref:Progestin and adipoQ receptor family member 4 n=1 Tax=Cacopsylla melanoneura TaxID=428564 RepID=A0A8D8PMX6_9HEMI